MRIVCFVIVAGIVSGCQAPVDEEVANHDVLSTVEQTVEPGDLDVVNAIAVDEEVADHDVLPTVEQAVEPGDFDVVNAIALNNSWKPIYYNLSGSATGFTLNAITGNASTFDVRAYNQDRTQLWQKTIANLSGATRSGFDVNGDGVKDLMLLRTPVAAASCNAATLYDRTAEFYSGSDGNFITSTTLRDKCILTNGTTWLPSVTLAESSFQYGRIGGIMAYAPRYHDQGWFLHWVTSLNTYAFLTPQTSSYNSLYVNDTPYMELSALLNGIIVYNSNFGSVRYVAFTSERIVQYAIAPYGSGQLVSDTRYRARRDILGRYYGLVQHDERGNRQLVSIIAGCTIADLMRDIEKTGAGNVVTGTDIWCGIERHASVFNVDSRAIAQSFWSYAHDPVNGIPDGYTYRNRVQYPARALLPSWNSAGSRLIYNLFDGSRWKVVITPPGGTGAAIAWTDKIVWDVIPRTADEVDVIASPLDTSRLIYVPDYVDVNGVVGSWRLAYYFPQHQTEVYKWKRSVENMTLVASFSGLPYLDIPSSPPLGVQLNDVVLHQTVRAKDKATNTSPMLIMRNVDGTTREQAYTW